MLNYDICKHWPFEDIVYRLNDRDVIMYALGLGFGDDPVNGDTLRFVYEKKLKAVPTMAAVIGHPGTWLGDPKTGVDGLKMLAGEQDLRLYRPLPAAGTLIARRRVLSVTDKGRGKGALVVVLKELFDWNTGDKIAASRNLSFLRADGGYSAAGGASDLPPEPLPAVPAREPDVEVDYRVLPQAALLYRLSGDFNPLHVDPAVAAAAGYKRPILHGLCTYGIAARAVIESVLGYDPDRLKRFAVRYAAPVWPGETLRCALWRVRPGKLALQATVDARNAVVLDNGLVEFED